MRLETTIEMRVLIVLRVERAITELTWVRTMFMPEVTPVPWIDLWVPCAVHASFGAFSDVLVMNPVGAVLVGLR